MKEALILFMIVVIHASFGNPMPGGLCMKKGKKEMKLEYTMIFLKDHIDKVCGEECDDMETLMASFKFSQATKYISKVINFVKKKKNKDENVADKMKELEEACREKSIAAGLDSIKDSTNEEIESLKKTYMMMATSTTDGETTDMNNMMDMYNNLKQPSTQTNDDTQAIAMEDISVAKMMEMAKAGQALDASILQCLVEGFIKDDGVLKKTICEFNKKNIIRTKTGKMSYVKDTGSINTNTLNMLNNKLELTEAKMTECGEAYDEDKCDMRPVLGCMVTEYYQANAEDDTGEE